MDGLCRTKWWCLLFSINIDIVKAGDADADAWETIATKILVDMNLLEQTGS
jgi:hypothetical protein